MSSVAGASQNFRMVSRRARSLLEKHIESKRPPGTATSKTNVAKSKEPETSWPKSIRYTFYTACAAAVPFSIGSAIAMSPRLRESLEDDTDPEDDGMSSNKVVHLVRQYWGNYDYLPPVDRPSMNHVVPGHRLEWQEDNLSSLLAFLGLYKPQGGESVLSDQGAPVSFENELPASRRQEQTLLARYLSPHYNPSGVKARLTLVSVETFGDEDNSSHEFECNFPAGVALSGIREPVRLENSSDAKQTLGSLFPGADSLQNSVQSIGWSGTYRFVLDFNNTSDVNAVVTSVDDTIPMDTGDEAPQSVSHDASKMILSNTSSHSSWSYFPDVGTASSNKSANLSSSKKSTNNSPQDYDNLRIEQLKYQISSLEKELKDPSSLRDRGEFAICCCN
jgi:hypothetical protein